MKGLFVTIELTQLTSQEKLSLSGAIDQAGGDPTARSAIFGEQIPTRADMANLRGSAGYRAYLTEVGREGTFTWQTGDQSLKINGDPDQALYVPPASDTTGASGAWKRVLSIGFAVASWAGVTAGVMTDQAAKINRLLAMVEVATVVLPLGTIYTSGPIKAPSGKSVTGQGRALSTIKALASMTQGDGFNPNSNALLYSLPNAVGVRFSDLSLDGSKVGNHYLNGITFYQSRGCVAERIDIKDTTAYATWAVGPYSGTAPAFSQPALDIDAVIFRDIWVYNANVHFEASYANNVLFERCHARDGDGDISNDNWFHPYLSQNITYRDCTGYGNPGAGSIIGNYLNTIETKNITFDNVSIEVLNTSSGMAIIAFNSSVTGVRVINSRIRSAGYIGAYTSLQGGTLVEASFENTSVDGLQEGLSIGDGTKVRVHGGYYKARSAGASANNYPINFGVNSSVVIDGPSLDGDGAALTTFPNSSGCVVLTSPRIVGDRVNTFAIPMGRGHKITRVLTADQTITNTASDVMGVNPTANIYSQFNFNGLAKGSYRVTVFGTYRHDTAGAGISISVQSYGSRRMAGLIEASQKQYDPAPVRGPFGTDTASVFAIADAVNSPRQFRLEFLFVAPDTNGPGFSINAGPYSQASGVSPSNGSVIIDAGSAITLEQV